MIKIKYNNEEGILNLSNGEVMFYHFKYLNIIEAIKFIEHDIESCKKEIEIFNNLLGNLLITSD